MIHELRVKLFPSHPVINSHDLHLPSYHLGFRATTREHTNEKDFARLTSLTILVLTARAVTILPKLGIFYLTLPLKLAFLHVELGELLRLDDLWRHISARFADGRNAGR